MRYWLLFFYILFSSFIFSDSLKKDSKNTNTEPTVYIYKVGIDDILDIAVIKPEPLSLSVTVAPDGTITFPYIGTIHVTGLSLGEIQEKIQNQLSEEYMRYPVVSVSLRQSQNRYFFIYGEVRSPGAFMMRDNTTVLKGISTAGGLTKFAILNNIKILRTIKDKPEYKNISVDLQGILKGNQGADISLEAGDIIVVGD